MADEQSCGNCRHSHRRKAPDAGAGVSWLECRRHPPSPHPEKPRHIPPLHGRWPRVSDNYYCGEWAATAAPPASA